MQDGGSSRCDPQGFQIGIPDNTETRELLDEGLPQLGIRYPDYGQQDDRNKDKQGTFNTIKEEWHDADSIKTRETPLRRDNWDV